MGNEMKATELAERTYLPNEVEELAEMHSFLEAHKRARCTDVPPRYLLAGEEHQVELPESMYRLLLQVVDALSAGSAVTVAPRSTTLTTQQAADLLGVSRPAVVRLIDAGQLLAQRPGTWRQVLLSDRLAYREQRRQRQYDVLERSALDIDEEDPAEVAEQLREVRKAVAARRSG
ncbi:helix-turn-helix domain-containing protein [Oerskovia sp. NPDC060338]|uniref:helix-turn-helix domain-containing protein n=1 Tax=Oerskovia sp. NPDC060338 TaxID=3347100 RepID=UPI00364A51DE